MPIRQHAWSSEAPQTVQRFHSISWKAELLEMKLHEIQEELLEAIRKGGCRFRFRISGSVLPGSFSHRLSTHTVARYTRAPASETENPHHFTPCPRVPRRTSDSVRTRCGQSQRADVELVGNDRPLSIECLDHLCLDRKYISVGIGNTKGNHGRSCTRDHRRDPD